MAIAAISKEGLVVLAILVAALWGCWLGQQHYLSQARRNIRRAAQDIRQLDRKTSRPAASVSPGRPLTNRTAVI